MEISTHACTYNQEELGNFQGNLSELKEKFKNKNTTPTKREGEGPLLFKRRERD